MLILDILFPKTCVGCGKLGVYFCPSCSSSFSLASPICPMCGRGSIDGITHVRCRRPLGMDGLHSLFLYRNGIKVAVKRLKYRFVREMGEHFIDVVMERMEPSVPEFFRDLGFRVVAVPLHRSRERWRGFNQAALLGEAFAERLGVEYVPVLVRTKDTRALAEIPVRLSGEERRDIEERYVSLIQRRITERRLLAEKKSFLRSQEMRGAFKLCVRRSAVSGQRFLLVDDVWTSGATMVECGKTLKRAGASVVWGLTFARGGR